MSAALYLDDKDKIWKKFGVDMDGRDGSITTHSIIENPYLGVSDALIDRNWK
jgi:hypothetical protein